MKTALDINIAATPDRSAPDHMQTCNLLTPSMAFQQPGSNTSPPPLLHPVPTHPMYIPEPPSTPGSPHGYQRFVGTSSPPLQQPNLQGYPNQNVPMYSGRQTQQNQYGQPPPIHQSAHGYQQHVPDFSAWGIDGATTQLGMQLGHSAVQAGQNYVQQNVRSLTRIQRISVLTASVQLAGLIPVSLLRHHFNVSNSYVIQKLRLLVFPWRHKPWSRKTKRLENGTSEWQPPREDINSPDLYIPGVFPP